MRINYRLLSCIFTIHLSIMITHVKSNSKKIHLLGSQTNWIRSGATVDERRPLVEDHVHKYRAGVFCQEDTLPADLRSKILHVEFATGRDAERLQGVGIFQYLSTGFQSQGLSVDGQRFLHVLHLIFQCLDGGVALHTALAQGFGVFRIKDFDLGRII